MYGNYAQFTAAPLSSHCWKVQTTQKEQDKGN